MITSRSCICVKQKQQKQQASKLHTIKQSPLDVRWCSNVFSDCCSLQCVIASRFSKLWKVTVQGESAKRRPESIQHFLFLVSVFLFGERDLYCRARYFTREKRCPSQVYKKTHSGGKNYIFSAAFLISELSRESKRSEKLWEISKLCGVERSAVDVMLECDI